MRGSIKYLLLVIALLAGAMFFAACGNDNGDGNGDSNGNGEATERANGDDNGGEGDLADFAGRFGDTEVRVTYTMTGTGDEAADIFSGEMTLYWKPPDRWRMDISSPDGDMTLINTGTATVSCFTEDGTGQCIESPLADALGVPFLSIFTSPDEFDTFLGAPGDVDVQQSSRQIAGQSTTCFTYSGEIEGEAGTGEVCFRSDGVLLFLRGEDFATNSIFTLEATNVSDSVSDDDLEPPFDIQTIPGFEDFDFDFDDFDFDLDDFDFDFDDFN